jgi:hypothetical protein
MTCRSHDWKEWIKGCMDRWTFDVWMDSSIIYYNIYFKPNKSLKKKKKELLKEKNILKIPCRQNFVNTLFLKDSPSLNSH